MAPKLNEWLVLSSSVGEVTFTFTWGAWIYWFKLPGKTSRLSSAANTYFNIFNTFNWCLTTPEVWFNRGFAGRWGKDHKIAILTIFCQLLGFVVGRTAGPLILFFNLMCSHGQNTHSLVLSRTSIMLYLLTAAEGKSRTKCEACSLKYMVLLYFSHCRRVMAK